MTDLRDRLQSMLGTAYSVERELAGGGMSRVFVATETALGRKVVVKVLPPEMSGAVSAERFKREIHVAAQLRHPHVVPVHAAGDSGELLFYTMPLVEGESLRARLTRDGGLSIAEAIRILGDIAEALAYAHAHGVVHRDIKPENVLLEHGHAVVTDFGVAKALSAATLGDQGSATVTGVLVGTPRYMAPEQAAGDPNVDHRADLYALGVLGYELLAGVPPFAGRTTHELVTAHLTATPEPVAAKRPDTPPALVTLVMRLLAKHPDDRPRNADEVLAELRACLTPSVSAGETRVPAPAEAPHAATRRWPRRTVLTVVLAVVLASVAYSAWSRARSGQNTAGVTIPSVVDTSRSTSRSVAVLPFANLSADPENEYFSDGVTEELVTALGKVEGLRVLSALTLKGPARDAPDLGRRLGVETLLSGSVRRAGGRLRISARLTNAPDGFQLWAESYEREMKDVFAVQDEIARAIVGALRVRLATSPSTPLVTRRTEDLTAYDLYLRGRHFWNKRTDEGISRAIDYFEQAIARDSLYALAHAGLGDAYAIPFGGPSMERLPKARAAALKALAIDSTLAEAHATLGIVAQNLDWDWPTAEREFRMAIALKPDYPTARHWYGVGLLAMGKTDEALTQLKIGLRLDPLSPAIATDLGGALVCAHRYDDAIEEFKKVLELDPGYVRAHGRMAAAYLQQGRYDEAIGEYRRAIDLAGGWLSQPWGLPGLGYTYAVSGKRTEALRVLRELEVGMSRRYERPEGLAIVHAGLGNTDDAMRWFERAVEERSVLPWWTRDPLFDRLRPDPRFARLMWRMGLEP